RGFFRRGFVGRWSRRRASICRFAEQIVDALGRSFVGRRLFGCGVAAEEIVEIFRWSGFFGRSFLSRFFCRFAKQIVGVVGRLFRRSFFIRHFFGRLIASGLAEEIVEVFSRIGCRFRRLRSGRGWLS